MQTNPSIETFCKSASSKKKPSSFSHVPLAHQREKRLKMLFHLRLTMITAVMGLAFVMIWLIALNIINHLMASIITVQKVSKAIAIGDLTSVIDSHSTDEFGTMLRAMLAMQNSLNSLAVEIQATVNNALLGDLS